MIDLPFKYRAAVVLRHVMGMDYAEAAREMDVPLNTYKSHLLRGTKLLRAALVDRLEPEPTAPMIHAEPVAVGGNGHRRGEFSVAPEQPLRR
jgi:predicted RNA polymerase sigma factor